MEMDRKELWFMNSRVRQFFQKHHEFRVFRRLLERNGFDLGGKTILDAGCGSGYSTELILEEYRPARLCAFDIMPEQVQRAKRRGLAAEIFVGDVADTGLPPESFDAAFVFGILHHVPAWRKALAELNRVLRPGGALLVEEPDSSVLDEGQRYFRLRHPEEARFDWPELTGGLNEAGFSVVDSTKIYLGHFMSLLCVK